MGELKFENVCGMISESIAKYNYEGIDEIMVVFSDSSTLILKPHSNISCALVLHKLWSPQISC